MVKRFLVLATTLLAWLMAAAPALAQVDTLSPALVEFTGAPGDSFLVDKTYHLDALPGAADIIIAIDTTGSMTGAIAQAKAQATQLCNDVQAAIPAARFAVFDFRDVPDRPATQGVLILTPVFTSSCAAVQAAINTMSAGGGGDFAEAYNWVFNKAANDPAHPDAAAAALDASRNPAAVQFLVVLGDAPPHNVPAPVTAPACGSQSPADAGINSDTEVARLVANDITLLMIRYSTFIPLACYQQLADDTGGTAVNAGGDLSDDIISQIQQAASHLDEVHLAVVGPCALDITFSPASYTNVTAPADLHFTETITIPLLPIGKYHCTVQGFADGVPRGNPEEVDVIVTAGAPATLTLSPKTAVNPVDTEHCVTATVKDALGQPVPGVTVRFTVTGSVNTSGSATTDANGEATFCYTGPPLPGVDTIRAYADTNNNNNPDPGEPADVATKEWALPVTTPGCEIKITNGGWIIANNGDKSSFGGNAMADEDGNVTGEEEYQDHGPADPFNLHGDVMVIVCGSDGKSGTVFGTNATIDGAGPHVYRLDLVDNGEPGNKPTDTYQIRIDNGYDSGNQPLKGGNIQVHSSS
jgi:Mg-chelatase subunit ChlD